MDYKDPKAFEVLREKINTHFNKELRVNHDMAVEKLLKMRKDDKLDEGIMKR